MAGTHERAVNAAVRAANLGTEHKPLAVLLVSLARQMDAAGPAGPSARLGALYLSALRQFGKAAPAAARRRNPYDELRARREGTS